MKMKNIYVAMLLAAVAGGSLTSCDDFLTEKPKAIVEPDNMGDSQQAVDSWVTGVYSKWIYDMFCWGNFPKVLELDCDYTSGPDWAFSSLGAGNFQGDETTNSMWTGCYSLINRANKAIQYVSAMKNPSEAYRNNALGELYFNKAYAYFLLTRAYGEIPLLNTTITNGADRENPRQPVAKVYEEIIRLLEQASTLMYKNTDPNYRAGHVCAGSAAGLLAKVYATMASGAMPQGTEMIVQTGSPIAYNGDEATLTRPVKKTFQKTVVAGYEDFDPKECYRKAAEWAAKILPGNTDLGNYTLLPYDQLWTKTHATDSEFLFSIQSVSGDDTYKNQVHLWYAGVTNQRGYITNGQWVGENYHWYCLFESKDYRIVKGVRHRWKWTDQEKYNQGMYYPNTPEYKLMATGYNEQGVKVADPVAPYDDGAQYLTTIGNRALAFTTKYDDVDDKGIDNANANYPMLRLADVVLIYAEAQAELGNSAEAVRALNMIRERSNASDATLTGAGGLNTLVLLRSAIFEERAKELALEGDRRWDLIRWGIYLPAMNAIGGYDESGVKKNREEKHLLFPIPNDEINANHQIHGNNPGWS